MVIETREWEQSGWLRFCVFPRQMSAAHERKEVRTVSGRRAEAIHLVIPFFQLRFKVNVEDILGQGGRVPPERRGRVTRTALLLHSNPNSITCGVLLLGDGSINTAMLVKQFSHLHLGTFSPRRTPELHRLVTRTV